MTRTTDRKNESRSQGKPLPVRETETAPEEPTEDTEYCTETALAFQNSPSEHNKQKAFLRYYGQDKTSGPDLPPLRR